MVLLKPHYTRTKTPNPQTFQRNVQIHVGGYAPSEPALLTQLLEEFQWGDVLVFDRLDSGANVYAELQELGIHFISRPPVTTQVERRMAEALGPDYFIVNP